MPTYDLSTLGFKALIVDPVIENKIMILEYDVDTKIGKVLPTLTTPNGSKYSPELSGVSIPTVNSATLRTKTLDKLSEYEI